MSVGPPADSGTGGLLDGDQLIAQGRRSVLDDEPPLILQHHNGRPISVPARYLLDVRDKEGDEMEQKAARKLAEKMAKRKRGVPPYYLYDFNQLNERHVDKFRLATRQTQERRATVSFVDRHNQLFNDQKEMESQGARIPEGQKVAAEMTEEQMADIVRDYSTYDFEKAEQIKEFVAELRMAAREATRWAIVGVNNPGAPKSRLKYPLVEIYGEYAIDLGINNADDTELNMSPEGMQRRKDLRDKELAKKKFEEFSAKKKEPKQQGLNLTLKKMEE